MKQEIVFFGSSFCLQPRPLHWFSRPVRQLCLLGVPKTKFFTFRPNFPPKTQI